MVATFTLRSSLQVPDAPAWHIEPGYSAGAAGALTDAYRAIRYTRQSPDAYLHAYVALLPYRDRILCASQRLHVNYALALAYTGEDALPQALDRLERALETARSLGDAPAQAEITYLAGMDSFTLSRLADAHAYFAIGLTALRRLQRDARPVDPAFELEFLTRLAAMELELGSYLASRQHLAEASELLRAWAPENVRQVATIQWLDALLARSNGDFGHALGAAMASADVFSQLGSPSAGRIHIVAAEIALDQAESFLPGSPGQGRPALIQLARTYATRAVSLVREADDPIGQGILQLARRRCDRLSGRAEGGLHVAEAVARRARRYGDVALLGRAHSALGDELVALGDPYAGRMWYYRAWRTLEEHELRAMAQWPFHSLQRAKDADDGPSA
jgi:tetratricopeptide (TPR) repeat protein